MRHWGPLITAAVVVLGLVGFLVTNTVGGLVVAEEQAAPPTATSAPPPATSEPAPPTSSQQEPPPSEQPDPGVPEQVFTGTATESRGLAIAVAVKGTEAAAYLCDGSELEAWLKGTVDGDSVDVRAANGSASLTGTLSDDRFAGEGESNGRPFTFDLDLADKPAGLYRGESGTAVIGWIVLEDGTQVGIANSPQGTGPAPELDPGVDDDVQLDGRRVAVAAVAGDTEF